MTVRALLTGAGLLLAAPALAQLPAVDPANRASVVSFWENVYQTSTGAPSGWTGNTASCTPGDVSAAYRDQGLQRLQYFRAMCGLPTQISLNPTQNAKAMDAALMMTANSSLSHNPPTGWNCYTAGGAEAAGKSNLALGQASLSDAMTAWIGDTGITSAGHRRWILYPPLASVGIGAVTGGGPKSYVLWVIGNSGSRPSTPEWVAWPPAGFVPYAVVSSLWSFAYPGADFGGATVTMTQGATPIPVTLHSVENGYGDNTLVWTPQGLGGGAPAQDTPYDVTVSSVMISGSPRSFSYTVTLIDPSMMVSTLPSTWGRLKALYR